MVVQQLEPSTASSPALDGPVRTTGSIDAPTAAVANNDVAGRSGVGVQQNPPLTSQTREAIADGASTLGRQAGVVSSAATAVAATAAPQVRALPSAVATGAAVVGVVAGAVEQLARPDIDQVITDAVALPLTEQINRRFPLSAPVTNEVVEGVKSLNLVRAIRERVERAIGERK